MTVSPNSLRESENFDMTPGEHRVRARREFSHEVFHNDPSYCRRFVMEYAGQQVSRIVSSSPLGTRAWIQSMESRSEESWIPVVVFEIEIWYVVPDPSYVRNTTRGREREAGVRRNSVSPWTVYSDGSRRPVGGYGPSPLEGIDPNYAEMERVAREGIAAAFAVSPEELVSGNGTAALPANTVAPTTTAELERIAEEFRRNYGNVPPGSRMVTHVGDGGRILEMDFLPLAETEISMELPTRVNWNALWELAGNRGDLTNRNTGHLSDGHANCRCALTGKEEAPQEVHINRRMRQ